MKITKNILYVLGYLFIAVNVLSLTVGFKTMWAGFTDSKGIGEKIGYFIGSFFLAMIGLLLVSAGRGLNKKIQKKKAESELSDFLNK